MQFAKNLKHIFFITAISLAMLFGAIFLFARDFHFLLNSFFIYRSGDGAWQDMLYTPHLSPSEDIVLVLVDEESVNALQAGNDMQMLTIPKSVYARVEEKLVAMGAKGIAYDIVFQNADLSENDFVSTLESSPNVVIATTNPSSGSCKADASTANETCSGTPRTVYKNIPWGLISMSGDAGESRPVGYDISRNDWQNWKLGSGTIRPGDTIIPTLPLALVAHEDLPSVHELQKHPTATVLNPYFGGEGSYTTIPFISLVRFGAEDLGDVVRGKYVFIGVTGDLVQDLTPNPVSGRLMPGVESHAHFLDGILQNKLLYKADDQMAFILYIIITVVLVMIYYFAPKYISPLVAVVALAGVVWLTRWMYDAHRLVVDIFPLFLSGALFTYPVTYIYKFFVVDREKRIILHTFSRYISPEVVKMIDMNSIDAQLGGEKKNLTILFSDIEGFTSIAEKADTKDLFYLMTAYLSRMTNILIEEHGTLDKYIGDAVMGFYGAPVEDPLHAIHACNTAVRMRRVLGDINTDISNHGMAPINFRIGIATGEVMVGNIGSFERFNYTVLGDAVNLAARLETVGKEYGVHTVISANTRIAIADKFLVRELDYMAVQGKEEAVRIFELIDTADSTRDMSVYQAYEVALKVYRDGRFLEAGTIWEKYMDIDPPSRVMAYRCVSLIKGDTKLDNGIYRMGHK